MMLVTRCLSVSRVESEDNNNLRSSFLASDSFRELPKFILLRFTGLESIKQSIKDSLCCTVVVSAKEGDSRSAKRFPSRQNSLESVK